MARRKRGEDVHGWVLLDKPVGLTSTQAVARVRRAFNARKAGHAGTLDPLASGMLPIALGEATKTVPYVVDGDKIYRFAVRWGIETDTDDAEGDPVSRSDLRPQDSEIAALLDTYTGKIEQVPPAFSAIRIDGERAYDLARSGEKVAPPPRQVTIHRLQHVERRDQDTSVFETACGKGTYVRALARDMGRDLGCHGHVVELRRLAVGPFREGDMISLDKLEELRHIGAGQGDLASCLRPVETALDDIPALAVSRADAARLKRGQAILVRGRDAPVTTGLVYAMSGGTLIALGEVAQGEFHPKRVFTLTAA
jgi:tRNA pseudouridine55 synthase